MTTGQARPKPSKSVRRAVAPFSFRGHTLDEFQIEAIIALQQETTTLVSAPTGTGKTLIADFLVDDSLRRGRRVVYTAPIKALVNQKHRDFRAAFGSASTGILTGDVAENPDAPLLVMTTEVLRNMLLQSAAFRADWVIFDEIHYINHPERGTVWEEAILLLPPGVRVLGLSATVPNIHELATWLEQVTDEPVATVVHHQRAVPLRHYYFTPDGRALTYRAAWERLTGGDLKAETLDGDALGVQKLREDIAHQERPRGRGSGHGATRGSPARRDRARRSYADALGGSAADPTRHRDVISYVSRERLFPCIYFAFSRRACEQMARDLARRRNFLHPHEQEAVHVTVRQVLGQAGLRARDVPGLPAMQQMWRRGIGVHHAGLVPVVKHIVEHLLERRILRVVYATETFAVGVNMPVRTVCFDDVMKFDGSRRRLLTQQEFFQMAGRAGRRGLDEAGTVLIRVDAETMAAAGWRDWEKAQLEPIVSRLSLTYTTVLNLIALFSPAPPEEAKPLQAWEGARASVQAWLGKSLCVAQSEDRAEAVRRLMTEVEERTKQLSRLGYLVPETAVLTPKGTFCRHVWIKELLTTELAFDGTLAQLSPAELAGWAAAMVWEPRPHDASLPPAAPGWMGAVQLSADRIARWAGTNVRRALTAEHRISPLVAQWAAVSDAGRLGPGTTPSGEDLEHLLRGYPLEAGDFITLCRQVVDFLRQIAGAAAAVLNVTPPGSKEAAILSQVRSNAHAAVDAVDRDVVAASRLY